MTTTPTEVPRYIVAVTEPPVIVCPPCCDVSQESHVADLANWEGMVIHHSFDRPDGTYISRSAYPDGTTDPEEAPHVGVRGGWTQGLELEDAERLIRALLAAIEEARA